MGVPSHAHAAPCATCEVLERALSISVQGCSSPAFVAVTCGACRHEYLVDVVGSQPSYFYGSAWNLPERLGLGPRPRSARPRLTSWR